ncbi:site-specific integrase [Nitrosopumilus sp. K4]|uniref:tyrosine-type recombinase/integrase n=1 Tax=Nitrosopumilus sp. K4 TaxID=2795383 RepID=UPI001BAAEBAB|nr:site-specific integrase [Nitrosopumilus sp. K4]QUC65023.1 site-specific integrase [Nitrosopumilus sp. K4]
MATPSQIFYESLKTKATKKVYKLWLEKFFEYAHQDYDSIIKLEPEKIKQIIKDYVIHKKELTRKTGIPSPNSYNAIMTPIQSFLEMNEIEFSWKTIKNLYPQRIPTSNQLPYTDDDIRELLGATTSLRNKAFIHFLSSTGVRVGATPDIRIEDVKEIEDGAVVTIYRDTTEEYRTCLTPEAYTALKRYLEQRIEREPDSVLFTRKNNLTPLTPTSAQDVVRNVRKQAKLSIDNGRKSRRGKSQNHAFRKRFEITLASCDLQQRFIDYMQGHFSGNSKAYFNGVSDEQLYAQFKRAIPALTLDKSTKIEAEKEKEIRIIKEEFDGALKEKLEQQDELMQRMLSELATAKVFAYETRYTECFGGKKPDIQKLSKIMSNEEIEDWNRFIPLVQREQDWTIPTGTKSQEMLRDSKEKREIKDIIKRLKKQGDTSGMIEQLEKMLDVF